MGTFMRRMMPWLILLSLAGPAWSMGGSRSGDAAPALDPETRAAWKPLLEEGRQHAASSPGWEHTVTHLAAAGLTPEQGREVLGPAREAMAEGLPAGPVLAKLDEGAVKGVPADRLRNAAEKRLAALREARTLLQGHGVPEGEDQGTGLLSATALALESGVPESTLASVLDRGKGVRPGQLEAVVEAGEALHLDGLSAETVEELMADCLDRQLRRPEVLRVVRFAREQHGRGLDGMAIRATLWGSAGGVRGGPGSGGPSGSGPGTGPGSSFGTGMGGPGMGGQGSMGGNRPPRGGPR